ncbi:MAG: hypothetical protein H7840_06275 [Alphaproteobacteria bacterium]
MDDVQTSTIASRGDDGRGVCADDGRVRGDGFFLVTAGHTAGATWRTRADLEDRKPT